MTSIHFALDRSGSMNSCINDTIGGFNHFIHSQQNDNPEGKMNLNLFAHDFDTIYKSKSIQEVEKLTSQTYFPRGTTALLDAIGKTIKKAEEEHIPIMVSKMTAFELSGQLYSLNLSGT